MTDEINLMSARTVEELKSMDSKYKDGRIQLWKIAEHEDKIKFLENKIDRILSMAEDFMEESNIIENRVEELKQRLDKATLGDRDEKP